MAGRWRTCRVWGAAPSGARTLLGVSWRTTEDLLERGWHTNDDLPHKEPRETLFYRRAQEFPGCLVRLVRGLSPTTHVRFERAAEIYAFGTQEPENLPLRSPCRMNSTAVVHQGEHENSITAS